MRLEPPRREDVQQLHAFFGDLSERSRYFRFHGGGAVDDGWLRGLTEPSWEENGALVGRASGSGGMEEIVALASYVRLRDPDVAEVAFAVADADQGRGIGTRLLEQLAARAGDHGIRRFVAYVLPDNTAMLDVLANVGLSEKKRLEGGVVEATLAIEPTSVSLSSSDRRDHEGVVASMGSFFSPGSVAVFGASPRSGSIGGAVFRNVLSGGFDGVVYPVNRDGAPVAGVHAYRTVESLPTIPDLAIVCVPGDAVIEIVESVLRAGTRAVCVLSAGFAEVGAEGLARQEELVRLVRAHGARLIGPNCLGLFTAAVNLNATFAPRSFPAGRIGVSSQSGAVGLALLERAHDRGLGFSHFVSIGNKADVSTNDLLEWWEADASTDVAVLYVESFGNPVRFSRIARRVSRRMPVLAMKSGSSPAGTRAAGSHTAALASSDAAVAALFRQAGVIRAATLEELLDTASLLASQPLPRGPRVGILTNAGGLGILCADACTAVGLELPTLTGETRRRLAAILPSAASLGNPVDMLGSATAADYAAVLGLMDGADEIDALIVLFVPTSAAGAGEIRAVVETAAARPDGTPMLLCLVSEDTGAAPVGARRSVPIFPYPESAARALAHAVERTAWLGRRAGSVPVLSDLDREAGRGVIHRRLEARGEGWLSSTEVRALLEAYGIPLVPERTADSPSSAIEAAEALGYPVAVKTALEGAHKTELGGVVLDLDGAEAVSTAAARIGGKLIVQPMVTGASAELLLGVLQDDVFGPIVSFGPGGTLAELIGDARLRLAPLTDVDVDELVRDGKAGRLVEGYRGAPPVNRVALGDVLHRLSHLADDLPEVAELDLNPVAGFADRVVVLDARARIARPASRHSPKSW
jgi:acetate---CoA ligase (ADP-forming)